MLIDVKCSNCGFGAALREEHLYLTGYCLCGDIIREAGASQATQEGVTDLSDYYRGLINARQAALNYKPAIVLKSPTRLPMSTILKLAAAVAVLLLLAWGWSHMRGQAHQEASVQAAAGQSPAGYAGVGGSQGYPGGAGASGAETEVPASPEAARAKAEEYARTAQSLESQAKESEHNTGYNHEEYGKAANAWGMAAKCYQAAGDQADAATADANSTSDANTQTSGGGPENNNRNPEQKKKAIEDQGI
jgi:hypothetical protein